MKNSVSTIAHDPIPGPLRPAAVRRSRPHEWPGSLAPVHSLPPRPVAPRERRRPSPSSLWNGFGLTVFERNERAAG